MQTYELKHPFKYEKESREIKTLNIRRPKVKDHINSQKSGGNAADSEIRLMSQLTSEPVDLIEEMDLEDYKAVTDIVAGFLGSPAKT